MKTTTTYIHRPIDLSWQIAVKTVITNLEKKYSRKFTENDQEVKDILNMFAKKHKEYWGIND